MKTCYYIMNESCKYQWNGDVCTSCLFAIKMEKEIDGMDLYEFWTNGVMTGDEYYAIRRMDSGYASESDVYMIRDLANRLGVELEQVFPTLSV